MVSEALASGLPVATTTARLNGTAKVVAKYGVGTVGAATPDGMAEAIAGALVEFDRLSALCSAVAAGLDWRILSQQLHEMLEQACVEPRIQRAGY